MAFKLDTDSRISLTEFIWIVSVFVAVLWGAARWTNAGFQLVSAVQANTVAINTLTRVIDDGFTEIRSRLTVLETESAIQKRIEHERSRQKQVIGG